VFNQRKTYRISPKQMATVAKKVFCRSDQWGANSGVAHDENRQRQQPDPLEKNCPSVFGTV